MKENKIIHWTILFLLIITPLLFFTDLTRNPYYTQITLLNLAVFFAVIVIALTALKDKIFIWKKTPLDTALFLFLIVATFSMTWSWLSHPYFRYSIYSETVKRWLYLLVNCYAAYYLAVLFVNDKNRKMYLDISIAVGVIAAGYGIMQYFSVEVIWPKILNPFGGRSVSTFGNPNFLSSFLVLLLPMSIHFFMRSDKHWKLKSGDCLLIVALIFMLIYVALTGQNRDPSVDAVIACIASGAVIVSVWQLQPGKVWYLIAAVIFTGSLLCTLTRSSWMGTMAAAGLYCIGVFMVKVEERKFLVILLIVLSLTVYFWPRSKVGADRGVSIKERIVEVANVTKTIYAPIHQRLLIWRCSLSMVQQFPFIGVGWGNFELFYPFYQGRYMAGTFFRSFRTHANNSHNEILEIMSQVGLIGFGVYLLIMWCLVTTLWKNKAYLFAKYDLLPLALFSGVIGMLVDNLLNVSLHFAVPGFQHWWQLGVLCGLITVQSVSIPITSGLAATTVYSIVVYGIILFVRAVFFQLGEVYFFKGFKYSKGNQLSQAVIELEKARSYHHLEVNNNYELANCYARLHERTKALFMYEEALRSNAGYDEIYFNMGAVYLQMNDKKNAMNMYERAVSINPLIIESYMALGNIYLEDINTHSDRLVALYRQCLLVHPDQKDIWNNLGYVYTKKGQHELALESYEKAVSLDPQFELARRNLQVALTALGRTSHPLLEREKNLNRLKEIVDRKDYTTALKEALALRQQYPYDIDVLIFTGNIYFSLGNYDKAMEMYSLIVEKNPQHINALNNLAVTYLQKGDVQQALSQFQKVLSIDPQNAIAKEYIGKIKSQ